MMFSQYTSLTLIEFSSDYQRLWSDCAHAHADLMIWAFVGRMYRNIENLMSRLMFKM